MGVIEATIENIKKKRNRALANKLNCIPSPYIRFRKDFPGIEKGIMTVVTSFTKGGKSQFTSYTFIYEPLMQAYYGKSNLNLTYLYFPLEESPSRIIERFMSYLLNKLTGGKIRVSPSELRSIDSSQPLSEEVLNVIESDEFQDILKYFEKHVIFSTESNPTGIYKFCKNYAEEHGTVYTSPVKYKDEFGRIQETQGFDHYVPNDEDEYIIPIIDTLNLVDTEKGMTQKQAMDKMSEYCAKYMRNRYNMCPILIQQQAFETEGNESFKLGRTKPSVYGLGDSKYSARDGNLILGLHSPARFGQAEYFGYDIKRLNDNVRFLEICVNRDGQMGGVVGLFFDGATCTFKELPLPEDKENLEKVYKYVKDINNRNKKNSALFTMISFANKLTKIYDSITNRKKCSK